MIDAHVIKKSSAVLIPNKGVVDDSSICSWFVRDLSAVTWLALIGDILPTSYNVQLNVPFLGEFMNTAYPGLIVRGIVRDNGAAHGVVIARDP